MISGRINRRWFAHGKAVLGQRRQFRFTPLANQLPHLFGPLGGEQFRRHRVFALPRRESCNLAVNAFARLGHCGLCGFPPCCVGQFGRFGSLHHAPALQSGLPPGRVPSGPCADYTAYVAARRHLSLSSAQISVAIRTFETPLLHRYHTACAHSPFERRFDMPVRSTDTEVAQSVSERMRKVRSVNTAPETTFRKALWAHGHRYRLHDADLPGKPDVVLPACRTAIFIDGDFWHGNQWARRKLTSLEDQFRGTSSKDYWQATSGHYNSVKTSTSRRYMRSTGLEWPCASAALRAWTARLLTPFLSRAGGISASR